MTKNVRIDTSAGTLLVALDDAKAPLSVANFLKYAQAGHFDGTIFHRVIKGFMIQGGGFEPGMKQKSSGSPIRNEANNGLKNKRYTLAMARTNDPHSATAQFFINCVDNAFLDHQAENPQGWGYAVFGHVVTGAEVITTIEAVRTGRKGSFDDVPVEDVLIQRVTEVV
jgi:peptidyl-prolyl cis-trans isomerase B (cyclophilin B)